VTVLPETSTSPAYAVERNTDGSVTVHIEDIDRLVNHTEEFVADMREYGIASVVNPPDGYLCKPLTPGEPGVREYIIVVPGETVILPSGGSLVGGATVRENERDADRFTTVLFEGDTVLLKEHEADSEGPGGATIAFIAGACDPVPEAEAEAEGGAGR
jgi:hypothetical protein